MLKRAASNAYSWWRASHIRTKQSKWLDGNLDEMEDTVKRMLKLIEPDADSFAKRAELYFKMRPELISFVEDVYKAYRALAERYDHISGELHKANHTIATSFPEQVQYAMLEDEDNLPRAMTPINPSKINKGTVEGVMKQKKETESSKKKGKKKKGHKVHMDKEQAQEEINKLQKGMLALQTEKEFVKSSYESGIAKYWEIEKQFMEMHEKVRSLEEEYNTSSAIEETDARVLMAETVLKSCEDTIVKLQEQRKKGLEQEKLEADRTEVVKEKLKALRGESCQVEMENFDGDADLSFTTENMEEVYSLTKTMTELQSIHENIKEYLEVSPESSVIEIAEKIEELANKVITMQITDSSRAMQINSLNSQNDELEKCIQSLEEDKVTLSDDSNELNKRLKEAGDELIKVQAIKKTIQDEEKNFRENFNDTWQSLDGVLEMLHPRTPSNNACIGEASLEEEISNSDTDLQRESIDKEITEIHDIKEIASEKDDQEKDDQEKGDQEKDDQEKIDQEKDGQEKGDQEMKNTSVEKELSEVDISFHLINNEETILDEEEATLKLQQLILSGLEGKDKMLLAGYTSILQNYKETKTKLSEVERKYEDYLEETRALIEELGELKTDIAMKDEELRMLKRPMRQLTKSMRRSSIGFLDGPAIQAHPLEVLLVEAPPDEAPSADASPDEAPLGEALPAEAPPAEAPLAEAPPAEAPLGEALPAEAPPAEASPVEAPLGEALPAEALPVEAPSVEVLPVEDPPAEDPPAEAPGEAPPVEAPTVKVLPAEAPVEVLAEAPSAESPPAEAAPAEVAPAEAAPAEVAPAEAAPAEAAPAEAPPAEAPRAEAPPAEAPRAEAPPAEAPRAEAPPAEALRGEAPVKAPLDVPHVEAPAVEASLVKSVPGRKKLERKSNPTTAEALGIAAPAPPAEAPRAEAPPAKALRGEAPAKAPLDVPHVEAPAAEASLVKSVAGRKKLERKSNPTTAEALGIAAPQRERKSNLTTAEALGIAAPQRERTSNPTTAEALGIAAHQRERKSNPTTAEALGIAAPQRERKSNPTTAEALGIAASPVEAPSKSMFGRKKLERKSNTSMETWSPIDSEVLKKNLGPESPAKNYSSGKPKGNQKSLAERFPKKITPFEVKFRNEIDGLLDEKLEFWLRFSTSFCQIQEIKAKYEDLEADIKEKDSKSQEFTDNVICDQVGKFESEELTMSLRELKTELQVWSEQATLLKEDLQNRYSSLCIMQDEILSVLNEDSESGELLISPYKAERFQGEVINMKLENSKVASELQVGLDQAKGLYDEIDSQLKNFGPFLSKDLASENVEYPYYNKANVPLRDFLFGVKPKKSSMLGKIQHGKVKAGLRKRDF